jgi:TetR/AcrR family transcriptional regulator, transcriptional repressor for nem operon
MALTQTRESVPSTRKGRDTRRRIVDAAADLVYERGVAGVSLDDVRRATGTSKSQLYHYFAGKNDLIHAVVERQRERVLGFHRPLVESLASWDDIQNWRDTVVDEQAARLCRGGCPLGSLANELLDLDARAQSQLSSAFAAWQQLLASGLDAMATNGALRDDANTADLALGVIAGLQGGLLLSEITGTTHPLEVALDTAIAHVKSFESA